MGLHSRSIFWCEHAQALPMPFLSADAPLGAGLCSGCMAAVILPRPWLDSWPHSRGILQRPFGAKAMSGGSSPAAHGLEISWQLHSSKAFRKL